MTNSFLNIQSEAPTESFISLKSAHLLRQVATGQAVHMRSLVFHSYLRSTYVLICIAKFDCLNWTLTRITAMPMFRSFGWSHKLPLIKHANQHSHWRQRRRRGAILSICPCSNRNATRSCLCAIQWASSPIWLSCSIWPIRLGNVKCIMKCVVANCKRTITKSDH